jgi:hypothetical protein
MFKHKYGASHYSIRVSSTSIVSLPQMISSQSSSKITAHRVRRYICQGDFSSASFRNSTTAHPTPPTQPSLHDRPRKLSMHTVGSPAVGQRISNIFKTAPRPITASRRMSSKDHGYTTSIPPQPPQCLKKSLNPPPDKKSWYCIAASF